MNPFPLGLDSPGKRYTLSSMTTRDATRSALIVAEGFFRGFHGHMHKGLPCGRYTPRDVTGDDIDETWCNLWSVDHAEAHGVLIPRNLRANPLVDWFIRDSKAFGWEKLADAHVAQGMADAGQLAFAMWQNPTPGRSGHIAPFIASLGEPGTWVANVGAAQFPRCRLEAAFGGRQAVFFGHP